MCATPVPPGLLYNLCDSPYNMVVFWDYSLKNIAIIYSRVELEQ